MQGAIMKTLASGAIRAKYATSDTLTISDRAVVGVGGIFSCKFRRAQKRE